MIEDVRNAKAFLFGHESICDLDEMTTFWRELRVASKAVNSSSLEDAIESFKLENNRAPNNDSYFL